MDFTSEAIVHNRLFFMNFALPITNFQSRSMNDRCRLKSFLFFILIQYFLNLLLFSRTVLLYLLFLLLFISLISIFFWNRCIFVSGLILYDIFIYCLLFFFIFLFVFYSSCVYWSLNSFLSVFVIVYFRHISLSFLDLL